MRDGRPTPTEALDWGAVFREHAPALRRFIGGRVPRALVEDTLQDTFVRALRSADRFDQSRPPLPWLLTIAGRACCETVRVLPREVPAELAAATASTTEACPHESFERHLRRQAMALAMTALSPRHRRLFREWELKGEIEFEALAAEEGITPQALKSVLSRARNAFRAAYTTAAQRTGAAAALAWSRLLRRDRVARTTSWSTAGVPLVELAFGSMAALMTAAVIVHGAPSGATALASTSPAVEQLGIDAGAGPGLDPPAPGTAPAPAENKGLTPSPRPPGRPPQARRPVSAATGIGVRVGPTDSAATVALGSADSIGAMGFGADMEVRCDGPVRQLVCDAARQTPLAR